MSPGGETDRGVPLVVDVDGTLVASDLLLEGMARLLATKPLSIFLLPWWLSRGRAFLKRRVAEAVPVPPATVPWNPKVMEQVDAAKNAGRPVWLASGADAGVVAPLADAIGAAGCLASDGHANLIGEAKAAALVARFGPEGFDYVGNHRHDLPVWKQCRNAICVGVSPGLARRLEALDRTPTVLPAPTGGWRDWWRALRPHQWTKNVLVFVPIMAAHEADVEAYVLALGVFAALSCCASGAYVFNDLLDLPDDRRHPVRRARPIAAGRLGILPAAGLGAALLAGGLLGGFALSLRSGLFLVLYVLGTLGYSLWWKRVLFFDVVVLALLYVVRIGMGTTESVAASPWLLAFSLFIFVALAVVKRLTELVASGDADGSLDSRRRYLGQDVGMMAALGAASAFASVVVLTLYIQSPDVATLYRRPELLGFVCPLLVYWLGRLLLLANRGRMDHDPIVFALRDRASWIVAVIVGGVAVAAL